MSDPLAWLDEEARQRKRKGLERSLTAFGPVRAGRIEHEGRTLIDFASNDYLGLAADPRVVAAASEAAASYGWGAGASPLVCGWRRPHEELALDLAAFEEVEAVALFPTGFAANAGTIAALVGPGDAVFHDRLNHACLLAGTRMAGASVQVYSHCDADRLAELLARRRHRFRRVLIATDGVFSMDGDMAPLSDLADVAERFDAMLLVDEAHATLVIGPDGRGAASACGVADRVTIRVGTLSKAIGSIGGFVAGSRRLIDHLLHKAPTLIYSTALPPAAAAAALAALRIARDEPARRERVLQLSTLIPNDLRRSRFSSVSSVTPIIPIPVGESREAIALSARLRERGLLVPAIRPPTVPVGTARLRVSVTAAHTPEDITSLREALVS
jgi:8-amino-7-oxononanoate synthase